MSRRTGTRGVPRAEREVSILRAATDLFGAHGYANVSIAAVAERADVSKALVLSYFASKDNLFAQCASAVSGRLLGPLAASVQDAAPGLAMANSALGAIFETLADHPQDWRLLHDSTVPSGSPASQAMQAANGPLHELARVGVDALLTNPDRPGDRLDASALQLVWDGIVASAMVWWHAHPDQSPADMTERVGRIMAALTQPLPTP